MRAARRNRVKTEGPLAASLHKTKAGKLVIASQTENGKLFIAFTD